MLLGLGGREFGYILISSENVISYVLFVSFCVRLYKIGVEVSFFVSNSCVSICSCYFNSVCTAMDLIHCRDDSRETQVLVGSI